MRQRIAIGIAFALPTAIAILDEPLNWLDPVAAYDLKAALGELVGDGLTLITALHDTATMCACCNAGIMLSEGQIKVRLDQADLHRGQSAPVEFERAMIAALRSAKTD
jgi:energy-coupling factor transporter ATP-binding protein EcfA2